MIKLNYKNFEKHGFKYVKFNDDLKKFIKEVNKIISDHFRENKYKKEDDYAGHVLKIQNTINEKCSPKYFFQKNKKIFKKLFNSNKFAIQHYFYFRAIKPSKFSKNTLKPVNFHRETFQGPKFFKNCINLWIPLKNCSNLNSLNYYPGSHKFKLKKDFSYVEKITKVKKYSNAHKNGSLYKEKILTFNKKIKTKKLFRKDNIILFSGELIHGSAMNKSTKVRMSLDVRFMLKEHMKFNPVQSSTNKKYFQTISINK